MNQLCYILLILLGINFTTLAQNQTKEQNKTAIKTEKMNTENITNSTVKNAIDALQKNDKSAWFDHFTKDAVFTDDGKTLDFKSFFENAIDKKEKFLSIDKVENEGKNIYGNFYAGQWGTFNVYFKFSVNENGKITKLDIGQSN